MQSGLQAIHISVSYMDEPSRVTHEEGDGIYFFLTLDNCRCLVKSINITSRNSNAIFRVPILLVS